MKRVEGSAGVALLECTNPVKGKWRVRWGVEAKEDGTVTYMEEELDRKPAASDVEGIISGSGVDALDGELETIGSALGYGRDEFDKMLETARAERIASDPQAQLMEAMRGQMSKRTDVDDEKALMLSNMFHTFSYLCKRGKEIKAGTVLRHGNRLWRAVQTHTPLSIYPPSIDTASLYTKVNKSHAGTLEDPIPYEQNMAFEKGKYYSQYEVVYLCILTTVNGYPNDLKDLPTIVQPV